MKTLKVGELAVEVYPTHDGLAVAAAKAVASRLGEVIQDRGEARAIFACAASQVRFLERLVAGGGVDWSRVVIFHMDEYLGIEASHPASFRRFLREHLVSLVRPAAFHPLAGEAVEPLEECERYEGLLRAAPIDLCVLGIGENGHVAFNDPPVANFTESRWVKLVALDEACRRQQVGEGAFPNLEVVPRYAYTLTVPALCAAGRLIGVVPERRKAEAVRRSLEGPVATGCPASVLQAQGHATLYLDEDSASLLAGG